MHYLCGENQDLSDVTSAQRLKLEIRVKWEPTYSPDLDLSQADKYDWHAYRYIPKVYPWQTWLINQRMHNPFQHKLLVLHELLLFSLVVASHK